MTFKGTFVSCTVLVLFLASVSGAAEPESTTVSFANSCEPALQSQINNAVTQLHSFEYLEAARMFDEIIEQDPNCAIAYWGAAMSIWHPLWAPPSQADLERGARVLARAQALQASSRERGYLAAISAFYSSTDTATHLARAQAHEVLMAELYANNLDDPEAAVFYALALLATADPHDKSYPHQFKSTGLLNW